MTVFNITKFASELTKD